MDGLTLIRLPRRRIWRLTSAFYRVIELGEDLVGSKKHLLMVRLEMLGSLAENFRFAENFVRETRP